MFPQVCWITSNFLKWVKEEKIKDKDYRTIIGSYTAYDNLIELHPKLINNPKLYFRVFVHETTHWIFNFLPWRLERKLDKLLDKYFCR